MVTLDIITPGLNTIHDVPVNQDKTSKLNVMDGQTDGRTDGQMGVSIFENSIKREIRKNCFSKKKHQFFIYFFMLEIA